MTPVMQQRDANFEPQEFFSSVEQLPVPTALNAQSSTLLLQPLLYTMFSGNARRCENNFIFNRKSTRFKRFMQKKSARQSYRTETLILFDDADTAVL